MTRLRIWATLVVLALASDGCTRDSAPGDMAKDIARAADLSVVGPDMVFPRCFHRGSGQACQIDHDCHDSVGEKCIDGVCCGGVLDPNTCECMCNGLICGDIICCKDGNGALRCTRPEECKR